LASTTAGRSLHDLHSSAIHSHHGKVWNCHTGRSGFAFGQWLCLVSRNGSVALGHPLQANLLAHAAGLLIGNVDFGQDTQILLGLSVGGVIAAGKSDFSLEGWTEVTAINAQTFTLRGKRLSAREPRSHF
jgi:hypothetical protein